MTSTEETVIPETPTQSFVADVLEGLDAHPRRLPCKYFYDQRGSQLFETICDLDSYYLTRTELSIMEEFAPAMARRLAPHTRLVEFGSGSSRKTRLLLREAGRPLVYVPVDISRDHLLEAAEDLEQRFPDVVVQSVCADFMQPWELPSAPFSVERTVVYFPGSTIGNFDASGAKDLLRRFRRLAGEQGGLLIGIDLVKETRILQKAYNDPQGVTAEFNLNLLRRINREADGDFALQRFQHIAEYNADLQRIEMYLESKQPQTVHVAGETFAFAAGERIHTENSHKYTLDSFADLATDAGFHLVEHWTDPRDWFAVLYLESQVTR